MLSDELLKVVSHDFSRVPVKGRSWAIFTKFKLFYGFASKTEKGV